MKIFAAVALATLGATLLSGAAPVRSYAAQASGTVEAHRAAARAAAGDEFVPLFDRLCFVAAPVATPARGAAPAPPAGPPPRTTWYADPVKVFDNLYFVGEKEYSAWAVITSDGIIVIDPVFDYSVEDAVVGGLRKLGVDPRQIKYVLVSHAHRDHVGGASLLQDRFKARVVMSAADWDLLVTDPANYPKPHRDMVATDRMLLTLGDTTLTVYATPGHTLGTLSTVIPVRDGDRRHTAVLWGGTAFNWTTNPARYITVERPLHFWFNTYIQSTRKVRDIVRQANADVILSNHTSFDGSKSHLPTLATRDRRGAHPYVVGTESVGRFLTVAEECARAWLAAPGGSL